MQNFCVVLVFLLLPVATLLNGTDFSYRVQFPCVVLAQQAARERGNLQTVSTTMDETLYKLLQQLPSSLGTAFLNAGDKIPRPAKFSGVQSTPETVREFLDSVDAYCEDLGYDVETDQSDCAKVLRRFLERDAKEEIRDGFSNPKATYDEIKDHLLTAFGATDDVTELQMTFYSRNQLPSETLAKYSRILQTLMNRILATMKKRSTPRYQAMITLKDDTLISRFCKGVLDPVIKQDLRRIERQHRVNANALSFKAFRAEVLDLYPRAQTPSQQNSQTEASNTGFISSDLGYRILEVMNCTNKLLSDISEQFGRLDIFARSIFGSVSRNFDGHCHRCGCYGHERRYCPLPRHRRPQKPPDEEQTPESEVQPESLFLVKPVSDCRHCRSVAKQPVFHSYGQFARTRSDVSDLCQPQVLNLINAVDSCTLGPGPPTGHKTTGLGHC